MNTVTGAHVSTSSGGNLLLTLNTSPTRTRAMRLGALRRRKFFSATRSTRQVSAVAFSVLRKRRVAQVGKRTAEKGQLPPSGSTSSALSS